MLWSDPEAFVDLMYNIKQKKSFFNEVSVAFALYLKFSVATLDKKLTSNGKLCQTLDCLALNPLYLGFYLS